MGRRADGQSLKAVAVVLAAACAHAAPQARLEPNPETLNERTLQVHLLTDDERISLARADDRKVVCKGPCDTAVTFRPFDAFVVYGPETWSSKAFLLPARDGPLTLRVSTKPMLPGVLGMLLLGGGGLVGFITAIAAAPAFVFGDVFCDQDPQCVASNAAQRRTYRTVLLSSLIVAAAGGALLIAFPPWSKVTAE
jgi:hypothetical protein